MLVDLSFGIQWKALAILAYLREHKVRDLESMNMAITCSPLYNGRERGICLDTPDGFVFFGEARNTDQIFVWTERCSARINPPTVDRLTDDGYRSRRCFAPDKIEEAADYIVEAVRGFSI